MSNTTLLKREEEGIIFSSFQNDLGSGFSLNLENPSQVSAKRITDIVISLLVLILILSWLFPILAIWIKSSSKGPVFFKQVRHGKNNSIFHCLKFRTMVVNPESDIKQASRNDPRVTKVGAILRKTSLDELPQIINVLRGEMSIVGPRPHPAPLNERFSGNIHNFMHRHAVKPGITGLAQAKGYRGETAEFHQMKSRVRMDIFYVKNWSLLLDFKIMSWTVVSLVSKKGEVY